MKLSFKYFLFVLSTIIITSCSSDEGGDQMVKPTPQETFGNWSPDFTNQTSNFTQTRTGSQGTEESRTINITSSSSTSSSTEEILEEDINDDGDLFEDIEVLVTTYTGSENLGSHQITSYEITVDNDNGILIGNEFISMEFGYIELDGIEYFCDLNNRYSYYILGINSIGSNFNDNNFYGNGHLIESEMLLKTDNLDSEGKLLPDQNYDLPFVFEVINKTFDQNISNYQEFSVWEESHFVDSDGDSYNDLEEIINNGDPNDPNITTDYDEYVSEFYCDLNGNLLLEDDNQISAFTFYNIEDGNYGSGTEIFTVNTSIKLNSSSEKYLFKGEGKSETGLPVKIYFNGFISLHDFTSETSKSSNKIRKSKNVF
jgi:hypothetical protein